MELAKLKVKAKETFEFNKDADKLIGVTDGSFFLPTAKSLAQDHARKTGHKLFEIDRELNSTHPQEAAEKLNAETAKKAREDEELQKKLKAEQEAKAKEKADEIAAENVVKFGVDVTDLTIKAVAEWASKQTDVELLTAAIDVADTKGGKAAIEDRIKELKTA